MSSFRPPWFLCGGWAIDAHLGRVTRDHGDVDITVFHRDQRAIFEHLAGWQLIAHDPSVDQATEELWTGRWLELPAHIHARDDEGLHLEVILNEQSGEDWVLNREPHIALALAECAGATSWGQPIVAAEILLFYKATAYFGDAGMQGRRPQDEADFLALLPRLNGERRDWLVRAISRIYPGHPWVAEVSG